jgi:hypothetical protein
MTLNKDYNCNYKYNNQIYKTKLKNNNKKKKNNL